MERVFIVDASPISPGLIDALERRNNEVLIVDYKTKETENMGSSNRNLLAALLSGAIAIKSFGWQVPSHIYETPIEGTRRSSGKGYGYHSRPSGAAAAKRAATKRRNMRARASKRA